MEQKLPSKILFEHRPSMCEICRERFAAKPTAATTSSKCSRCQRILQIAEAARLSSGNQDNPARKLFAEGSLCRKLRRKLSSINERAESFKSKEAVVTSMNSTPSAWVSASVEHPRKRALLCAVSYKRWKYRLKGTLNDVKNFRELLINNFGFPPENILVLTEEEQDQSLIPTKCNILRALQWLVKDCESGDSLVFYFSGHGLRQPDFSDDELDGFDETICPVDFMKEGMILDNDINSLIVLPLKKGVTLHAIVDACHSGTILDLEYVYDKEKNDWKDNRPPSGKNKKPSGGLAISISACDDAEFASDTSAFTGNTMNGAMTYLLIDAIKSSISNNMKVTYGDLIDKIYNKIEEISQKGCFGNANVLRGLFIKKTVQKPQLSSSDKFDVYNKTFEL